MTIQEVLQKSTIDRTDAEVLLARLLRTDRSWILGHTERELMPGDVARWNDWQERRLGHEPVAYITGQKEFYGKVFSVDRRVLVPRPATEGLIDAVLVYLDHPRNFVQKIDTEIVAFGEAKSETAPKIIVDVGTGSGCIAITLKLQHPEFQVIATDSSADAITVAQENATKLGASIDFRQGSGLEPIRELTEPFLVVSNPPYIPEDQTLMPDVALFEPKHALFAGKDGTDVLKEIISDVRAHPHCTGFVVECREEQALALAKI